MNWSSLFQELRDDGLFAGRSKVVLAEPFGSVSGTATVRVTNNSRSEAEVSIEEFEAPSEYDNNLVAFLNASPPRRQGDKTVVSIGAGTDDRLVTSFALETDAGVFSASSGVLLTPVFWGFQPKETLSLVLNDLTFSPRTNTTATYWLIPLHGPFENHYLARRTPLNHLLAFDGASFIPFVADGHDCGLQMFELEKKPVHPLATYDAIAFGEIHGTPSTLDKTWDALPRGILEALSFAVGADVTSPWIELRGNDGSLVRRFYFRLGHRSSPEGFAAFSKINEFRPGSGIGPFLTAFFSMASGQREGLIPPLNLMRSGAPGSFTIEDSITDLVKALDNLCERHGFSTQELLGRLEQDNQQTVKDVLANARKELCEIMTENKAAGRQAQTDVLTEILGKLASAASTSRKFGIAVKDLLQHFGLHDADVLDRHYGTATLHTVSWADMLSAVRGEVIHKGVLRITDRRALRSWFEFARHLHDLCKRIVFSEVGYSGLYQASTNPWQGEYAVNRVTPTLTAKDLGFSEVPTHI